MCERSGTRVQTSLPRPLTPKEGNGWELRARVHTHTHRFILRRTASEEKQVTQTLFILLALARKTNSEFEEWRRGSATTLSRAPVHNYSRYGGVRLAILYYSIIACRSSATEVVWASLFFGRRAAVRCTISDSDRILYSYLFVLLAFYARRYALSMYLLASLSLSPPSRLVALTMFVSES